MSLIGELINEGTLKTPEIIKAFRTVRRRDFIRSEDAGQAEVNEPLRIGFGQTISQPLTVAFMLEKLRPRAGEKILDIGCGSGWTTALLAFIVGDSGKIYGLERICELKNFAATNVNKYIRFSNYPAEAEGWPGRRFIKNGVVHIICSDGFYGLPEFGPFDKILVSAAAEEVPSELLKQLEIGGRLVMAIGRIFSAQSIRVIDKVADDKFKIKEYPGFIFVPLIKNG